MTQPRSSSSRSAASGTSSIPTRWNRSLTLQFLAPTIAALLGGLLVAAPYVAITLERHQLATLAGRLEAEAREAAEVLPWAAGAPLDAACARMAANLRVRITVIAGDGHVLGESSRSSETLEDHAGRPEVRAALASGLGRSVRHSVTVGEDLIYVAVRDVQGEAVRVVRLAASYAPVHAAVGRLRTTVLAGLVAAMALGFAAATLLARRALRRIRRLVEFARRVAAGEPAPYIRAERADDLGVLEDQVGDMAGSVATTIADLRVERERLEAILRGMVEGVVVTDLAGTVVLLNARARTLLDVPPEQDARGRPLIELVRDPAVANLPRELARADAAMSRDATLGPAGSRLLQVNAAPLRGADGAPFGCVLVLHDVTELRRLEVIRRDFVANVSHELRTPLTAIKGYAETLLGPAGDDRDTARRFLAIIDRHSERLARLIDDLLTLSDLELGRMPLRLGTVSVGPVLDDVLQILASKVRSAGVDVHAKVEPGTPPVQADGDRLRQVLINLVDNAIKYTGAGGSVRLHVARAGDAGAPAMVQLTVEDTGIGIPAQDLPRLTERFFRVDKARSRDLGGTGLGLAIVKHIVQLHGGSLGIASTLGHGTTVRVLWPAAAGAATAA